MTFGDSATMTDLMWRAEYFGMSIYSKEYTFPILLPVRKNLQNSFTADAENEYPLLENKHPPSLVCFVRLCEVFLGQCWQRSIKYCVSVPEIFVSYSNNFFLENQY
jgi:hypothetical protein